MEFLSLVWFFFKAIIALALAIVLIYAVIAALIVVPFLIVSSLASILKEIAVVPRNIWEGIPHLLRDTRNEIAAWFK